MSVIPVACQISPHNRVSMDTVAESGPAKRGIGKRIGLTAVILAFLLFPAAGLIFFWTDMHNRIRKESEPFARESMEKYFATWEPADVLLTADSTLSEEFIEDSSPEWEATLGPLKSIDSMRATDSWVKEREEKKQAWQHVTWDVEATFEKGKADIEWQVTRPFALDSWVVESVTITPVSSGA